MKNGEVEVKNWQTKPQEESQFVKQKKIKGKEEWKWRIEAENRAMKK